MEIKIHTNNAARLLEEINSKIDDDTLNTWSRKNVVRGNAVYHTPNQWDSVLLMSSINHNSSILTFTTSYINDRGREREKEGYVVGRFVEPLMVHFIDLFDKIEVTK